MSVVLIYSSFCIAWFPSAKRSLVCPDWVTSWTEVSGESAMSVQSANIEYIFCGANNVYCLLFSSAPKHKQRH